MSGVIFVLDNAAVDGALTRLDAMGRMEFWELTESLAALGVSQTQKRIEEEKTAPDGHAWPKTSDGRGALFVKGDHLYRSIQHDATADQASVGTGWIGARLHQSGATIGPKNASALAFHYIGKDWRVQSVTIPARPYIGLSDDNAAEMEIVGATFLERFVR